MSNLSLGLGLVPSFLGRLLSGFSLASLFAASEQGVWYDPSDKANLDWRRNLLRDTASFQTSNWVALGSSISVNAAAAPDGTMTADKVVEDTSTGAHRSLASGDNAVSVNSGQTVAFSIYVKAAGRTHVYIRVNNAGGDIVTGTVRLSDATVTQTIDGVVTAQTAGDGWVRVVGSGVSAVTASTFAEIRCGNSDAYAGYTGDGASGIFLWGAQLELGSTATAYQKITDVFTETRERFPNATLYQDSAGTQPAASAGDAVGLMLDKSQGLVRGPELVTNGGFDSATGWTLGTGWTISGGVASFNNPGGSSASRALDAAMTAGAAYEVTFDLNATSGAGIQIGFNGGGGIDTGPTFNTSGAKAFVVFASLARTGLQVTGIGGSVFTIDNISVREIPGNHATQSTTASKPILARHPVGGRRNLLTYTEAFGNAVWASVRNGPFVGGYSDPFGGSGGQRFIDSSAGGTNFIEASHSPTVATSSAYSFSIYAKADQLSRLWITTFGFTTPANGATYFDLSGGAIGTKNADHTASIEDVGGGWFRCSISFTTDAADTTGKVAFGPAETDGSNSVALDGTSSVLIFGGQFEKAATATDYQKVVSQYNVTEAGKADLWYLAFDGFDDSMATGNINFTSTDEMTVIAGVRKLSDAAVGVVAELSGDSLTNNGSFALFAPISTSGTNRARVRGTASLEADWTGQNAPITIVPSFAAKIASLTYNVRSNGVLVKTAPATGMGTGNFGNYPLYLGRRGGSSFPYNGHLYGLVVRGALTAGDTLTKAEDAINEKTGAYERRLGQVATRVSTPDTKNASFTQLFSRTIHTAQDDLTSLQAVFANWYVEGGLERATGADATIYVSVEYPLGSTPVRMTIGGNDSGTIPDGGNVVTDATAVSIPKGAQFAIKSFWECSAGFVASLLIRSTAHDTRALGSGSLSDQTTTTTNPSLTSTSGYSPVALIAQTAVNSAFLAGDSRVRGSGDDATAYYKGETEPAIAADLACINVARSAESLFTVNAVGGFEKRLALAQYCTHVLSNYGINDITGGADLSGMTERLETFAAMFSIPVYQTTLSPRSTSTDGWATVGNQTTVAENPVRVAVNDAIRAGSIAGYAGYFEAADETESARNSGLWKAGYTADGTHANATGYNAIETSGVIDAGEFR